MATTHGKVTTTTATLRTLGKGVKDAEKGAVLAWLAVLEEFSETGGDDLQAFARAFVKAQKGTPNDIFTENTVRQQVSKVKWAEENIKGGARACASMKHIQETRSGGKAKATPAKAHKVSTVTVSDTEFARALRKAGLSAEVIAIATKAVFTTAK